jgi:methylisocitrate lyase
MLTKLMTMKPPSRSPGLKLREAWQAGAIAIPGVFNGLVAKMAQRIGFKAVYLSGGALSACTGVPDVGLLTMTEFADEAGRITAATDLPLLADADTGFGEALNVERTVWVMESAGVAGIHLEDQQMPKRCGHLSGKQLIDAEDMAAKIRAAAAARRDKNLVIMARTDARSVEGFDRALERAQRYVAAGADAVFPEALETEKEFADFAKGTDAPLLANMTEFGRSPLLDFEVLAKLGYRMVLYPLTALRSALRTAETTLQALRDAGNQRAALPGMLTRQELYDILGYSDYEKRDRAYFGGGGVETAQAR